MKKSGHFWTMSEIKTIKDMYAGGRSYPEIAKEYSVTASVVGRLMRRFGTPRTPNQARCLKRRRWSSKDIQRIISLYDNGASYKKIGQIYNCSQFPISKIIQEHGMPRSAFAALSKINHSKRIQNGSKRK